ncbi:MAG TPA: chemotaxis protein CheB [Steroidobacteraceae bacterium]|nr:chemotaxis protein CheB [Steroidobacteraceae bacterium]
MNLAGRIDAVVIGASAGGIEALLMLLPALPPGLRPPVFIVLHLPRDKPSLLAQIFARKCAVPVREAEDKDAVAAGTVYFAPNDYHLLLDDGPQLSLSADDPVHHSRPSIDVLFESAAEIYHDRLMGIILSGANEDGASGLAAIHDAGGLTVVQCPQSARAPHMALCALKLRPADCVLPLDEIAEMLRTLDAGAAPARIG